jgi:PAS domain S-box-containing protein
MFVGINSEGLVTLVNKKTCEIFGYNEDEMTGKNWFENFVPQRFKSELIEVAQKLLSGKSDNVEYFDNPILTKKGEERIIHWHNTQIRDENKKIIGLLSSGEDITEKEKAEKELIESEVRLSSLFNRVPIGLYRTDPDGQFIAANPALVKMLGYPSHKKLLNTNVKEIFVNPELRQKELDLLKEKGIIDNHVIQLYHFNGHIIYVQDKSVSIKDSDGKILYYEGSIEDITERKKAEKALKESEEKYRIVVENTYDWEYWLDPQDRFTFVSQSSERISGYKPEEFYKDKYLFEKIIHPDDKILFFKNKSILNKKGERKPVQFRIITKKGKVKWIGHVCKTIRDPEGNYLGIRGSNRPIKKLKKIENAFRKSEEKYKNIIENLTDVYYRADTEEKLIMISPSAVKTFGYSSMFEILDNTLEILYPKQKERNEFIELIKRDGIIKNYSSVLKKKDGTEMYVETNANVLLNNKGEYLGIEGIIRDVTERKKSQEALLESEQELRKLNAEKDKFFSIIAHDLKSPFSSMIGFSDLLMNNFDDYDAEQIKKFLGFIHQGIHNIYKLLENLLLWSRTQRGVVEYIPEKINLYIQVDTTIKLLEQAAEKKSISVQNNIQEEIYIDADKNMVLTIFRNLISNAIKFTPIKGQITVDANIKADKKKKNYVEISVSDTGVGINKETLSQLFLLSGNVSSKGTEGEEGTGLGLILCKEFVKKHGGEISVKSKEKKGTTFTFTLPSA